MDNNRALDIRFLNSKVEVKRRNYHEWPKKHKIISQDYITWKKLVT